MSIALWDVDNIYHIIYELSLCSDYYIPDTCSDCYILDACSNYYIPDACSDYYITDISFTCPITLWEVDNMYHIINELRLSFLYLYIIYIFHRILGC